MGRERPQVIVVQRGGDHGCLITILLLLIAWPLAIVYWILRSIIFATTLSLGLWTIIGLVWWVIFLGNAALCVMAGIAANKGQAYRYPVVYRLVK